MRGSTFVDHRVETALRALSGREEQILRLRFGIGGRMHALDDLQRQLGGKRPRVQQIQRRALRKLRAAALQ